jgi:uncharacterized protein (TIGR02246 family)
VLNRNLLLHMIFSHMPAAKLRGRVSLRLASCGPGTPAPIDVRPARIKRVESMLDVVTLAIVLALATAASAAGQETDAKQKIENNLERVRAAHQHEDAAAFAQMFAPDGVLIGITGQVFRGRDEITKAMQVVYANLGGVKNFEDAVDEAHPLPDGTIWSFGHAKFTGEKKTIPDHWGALGVPDGDGMQIKMLVIGIDLPPQPVPPK